MRALSIAVGLLWCHTLGALEAAAAPPRFKKLSVKAGDLPAPFSPGQRQQTSSVAFDANQDGTLDFAVTERTGAPSVILYVRTTEGWRRDVIEPDALKPEAGSCAMDVDGDGDLDLIAGADSSGPEVWWWENPFPKTQSRWRRRLIKASGGNKHHDQIAADFDGDGKPELVFWNQGANALIRADVPASPRNHSQPWKRTTLFVYSSDGQPLTRLTRPEPSFKGINEHEGIAVADIDGDGKPDLVGGGQWFKFLKGNTVQANPIDPTYTFTRAAVGQLIPGGRPEVILVAGDGTGPLMMYEWLQGTWVPTILQNAITDGHSLAVMDIDKDGLLDIFVAEMRINGRNAKSKMQFLLGNGKGTFKSVVVAEGEDNHETKVVDLNNDGWLDILGKPYNFDVPGVNLWINLGAQEGR